MFKWVYFHYENQNQDARGEKFASEKDEEAGMDPSWLLIQKKLRC